MKKMVKVSRKIKKKIYAMGYRFTSGRRYSDPAKILQLYTKNGRRLKEPRVMNYTPSKAHDLTYHSLGGANTYVVLWKKGSSSKYL